MSRCTGVGHRLPRDLVVHTVNAILGVLHSAVVFLADGDFAQLGETCTPQTASVVHAAVAQLLVWQELLLVNERDGCSTAAGMCVDAREDPTALGQVVGFACLRHGGTKFAVSATRL